MGSFPETLIDPKFSRCCGLPFTHHASFISLAKGSLPRSRFLDVTQRSPKRGRALRDIQKTAARETRAKGGLQ